MNDLDRRCAEMTLKEKVALESVVQMLEGE